MYVYLRHHQKGFRPSTCFHKNTKNIKQSTLKDFLAVASYLYLHEISFHNSSEAGSCNVANALCIPFQSLLSFFPPIYLVIFMFPANYNTRLPKNY